MIGRERAITTSESTAAPPLRPRKTWVDAQSVFWFRCAVVVVGVILRYWIRCFRAIGAEKVPAGGTFVIANHTSGMDPFLLGYPIQHRMPWGPGKVELFKNPVFGFLMRKIGMFPIRNEIADAGAVRTMVTLYRSGKTVIVYPEGGRSVTGDLRPFRPEFARLAIKLRARIVPAAIAGAADVLPIGGRLPIRNCPVVVVFGEPFDLSEYYDRKLTPELVQEAADRLQASVQRQLEIARSERADLATRCP